VIPGSWIRVRRPLIREIRKGGTFADRRLSVSDGFRPASIRKLLLEMLPLFIRETGRSKNGPFLTDVSLSLADLRALPLVFETNRRRSRLCCCSRSRIRDGLNVHEVDTVHTLLRLDLQNQPRGAIEDCAGVRPSDAPRWWIPTAKAKAIAGIAVGLRFAHGSEA
jgi:hypothetical protein